jgi:hypothetical protein
MLSILMIKPRYLVHLTLNSDFFILAYRCDGLDGLDGTVRHMYAAAVTTTPNYRALRLRLARVTLKASRQCIYRGQLLS